MTYRISEAHDGRFIVDREAGRGLWLVLVGEARDCRSTAQCYEAIAADWLMGDMSREVLVLTFLRGEDGNPLEPAECPGHPADEYGPMGETQFCDGSCQAVAR